MFFIWFGPRLAAIARDDHKSTKMAILTGNFFVPKYKKSNELVKHQQPINGWVAP